MSRDIGMVSEVFGIVGDAQARDVEASPCHHRCSRRPVPVRGSPHLRGLPGLDQPADGPLPPRGARPRSSRCHVLRPQVLERPRRRPSSWSCGCASSSPRRAWMPVPTRSAGTWPTITPPPCRGRRSTGSWSGPARSPRTRPNGPRAHTSGSRPISRTRPGSPTSPTTGSSTAPTARS